MLEKPDVQDEKIIACLLTEYRLDAKQIAFLSLGADINTAVYRVFADDGISFFLKLRKNGFDRASVTLPNFLSDLGIRQIIPPVTTGRGRLWGTMDAYKTILYPFIEGRNGYEVALSDRNWREFGQALKRVHDASVPPEIAACIRCEDYSPRYRRLIKSVLSDIKKVDYDDPVAIKMAAIMKEKRAEIVTLIERAEQLAQTLQKQSLEFIVCHSDIHAGNIFIGADNALYIVDWDEPIRAPKERDLMYIGGGLLASGLSPEEEVSRFYQAYGEAEINAAALAYYRYERIIQDIAAFCEQLLLTDEGGADREQSLAYFESNFLPDSTIEIACRSDGK